MKPRKVSSWHEYFFKIANDAKDRSKDPSRQVGALIVKDKRIISTGYNGFPSNCDEIYMNYGKPDKYGCIIHAELNAILCAEQSIEGAIMYTTNAPCDNCLKHIIQKKIKTVYYESADIMKKRATFDQLLAIRRLIKSSDIEVKSGDGINYIDDLRSSFPFEMFHPDNVNYQRHELREYNSYLVFYNEKYITTISIKVGNAITNNDMKLDDLLKMYNLTESMVNYNRI